MIACQSLATRNEGKPLIGDRIKKYNHPAMGRHFVIYWMQQSQRIIENHALAYAIHNANNLDLPVIVIFIMSDGIPDANLRHYHFMLEGIYEVFRGLNDISIPAFLFKGSDPELLAALLKQCALLVTDVGYLHYQKQWREAIRGLAQDNGCGYFQVESDVIVPLEIASPKEEYSAATLRPKILEQLSGFLHETDNPKVLRKLEHSYMAREILLDILGSNQSVLSNYSDHSNRSKRSFPLHQCVSQMSQEEFIQNALSQLHAEFNTPHIDIEVKPVSNMKGGHSASLQLLHEFIDNKLSQYHKDRSNPALQNQSYLSPYLHFGQISALEIVLHLLHRFELPPDDITELIKHRKSEINPYPGLASYCEELIIRRELSMNFCHYNPDYDNFTSLPNWARQTLIEHSRDQRFPQYSLDKLECFSTRDIYWNAAQKELVQTGLMHNYMRMYWGKKIVEWISSPEDAMQVMIYLNNKYALDGRDPNSYAGIAWCLGKHDRPWSSREIFGKVRYMSFDGLTRKYSMREYIRRIEN